MFLGYRVVWAFERDDGILVFGRGWHLRISEWGNVRYVEDDPYLLDYVYWRSCWWLNIGYLDYHSSLCNRITRLLLSLYS